MNKTKTIIVRLHMSKDHPDIMTIRQAAAVLDVSIDTIRYWGKIGAFTPKRTERGWRVFTPEDIKKLKKIKTGPFFKAGR